MRAGSLVVIITDHTGGQMDDYLEAILFKATQALAQIFQLHTEPRPTAATAGKGHITCIRRIISKLALTAVKGMGAVIATAALLHLLTLDNNN